MNIGEMRHRLTLQAPTKTPDGGGGYETGWADTITVWAKIEPLTSREVLTANQYHAKTTHRITIRYREGVTTANQFKKGGRVFSITSIINVGERNEWLEMLAVEGGIGK